MLKFLPTVWLVFGCAGFYACTPAKEEQITVKAAIDRVVTDLYATQTAEELTQISPDNVIALFTKQEQEALATTHWMFDVNVPAVVSVMRSTKQAVVPFWLAQEGFVLTDKVIRNEQTTYEVWQKKFDTGRVGLGINGFENYGLHYFVSVAPQNEHDSLQLSNFFPENQYVGKLQDGAFTYHDWDELVISNVPEVMKGQALLTTIRGRGTESHLIKAFRKTIYPSSDKPDQVMLTWSGDPSTTTDIQWRTSTTVETGKVIFREKGTTSGQTVTADTKVMEDRLLMNDRFIHRHTAKITGLTPGTTYEYIIHPETGWDRACSFTTAGTDDSFSFLWFGDTHNSPDYGKILEKASENHEDISFLTISGDLVNDGLYRNQWDDLFAFSGGIICGKPLMTVPGNHDNRAGLGAAMFRDMFSYPQNGPADVPSEQTYTFTYENCLFLMIDATSSWEGQSEWIESRLSASDTKWKIAVFHFPPYNHDDPYKGIQKAWLPLFDQYQVDLVLSGHEHYYMRSKPLKDGKIVPEGMKGTVYAISIAIPARSGELKDEPYAVVRNQEGHLYQYISIKNNTLEYKSVNINNKIIDEFSITKP